MCHTFTLLPFLVSWGHKSRRLEVSDNVYFRFTSWDARRGMYVEECTSWDDVWGCLIKQFVWFPSLITCNTTIVIFQNVDSFETIQQTHQTAALPNRYNFSKNNVISNHAPIQFVLCLWRVVTENEKKKKLLVFYFQISQNFFSFIFLVLDKKRNFWFSQILSPIFNLIEKDWSSNSTTHK
jgi:hypothetical protein